MLHVPASNAVRGAGWCLALLLLASARSIGPGRAEPQAVASSVSAAPVAVLQEIRQPDSTPVATPTPTPTPVPSPTAEPTPQPVSRLAPPAAPAPSPAAPAPPPSPPQPSSEAATSATIVSLTNELRARHGLPSLATNGALVSAAQAYAETLATNNWFSHDGPDGSTLASRMVASGYTNWSYVAENLYRGFQGEIAASIVQAWVASPAHLEAMLSDAAREIGVGCYVSGDTRWCVQEFGSR